MTPFYKVLVSFNGFVYDVRMVVLIVHNSEKAAMIVLLKHILNKH